MIVAAVMTAALRYVDKPITEPNNVELHQLSQSLAPVSEMVPESTIIGCDLHGVKTEVFLWIRYLLAPRYIPYKPDVLPDTSLVICPAAANDSLLRELTLGKVVIWSGGDSLYSYFLTARDK